MPATASIHSSKPRHRTGEDRRQERFSSALPPCSPTVLGPRPAKRLKTNLGDSISLIPATAAITGQDSSFSLPASLPHANPTVSPFPLKVQHLQDHYEFSTMSVKLVERLSFANVNAKPGIVILQAKAAVASKLISIVEISKADIATRGEKQRQLSRHRRPLIDAESRQAAKGDASTRREPSGDGVTSEKMDVDDGDSEDGGVAFERLQAPSDDVSAEQPRVRLTPIISVYFSCVPVPGLKKLYGEQTNA
ncbi:MAG: hypothetical protein L6R35_001368 [Caloplaca aegaea]|nr:MAG: hypothetical protein L6R35_001368 [Caloplaca aegaea]